MEKIKKVLEYVKQHKDFSAAACFGLVAVLIVLSFVFTNIAVSSRASQPQEENSAVNPSVEDIIESTNSPVATEPMETTKPADTKASTAASQPASAETTTATKAQTTTAAFTFATAVPPKTPADYQAQWDAGYLIAIDNPDPSYKTGQITLTDKDRDLLERLCYGEFGTGGFIGASLIAQAVKDTMYSDGVTSVAQVIKDYGYTGSTDRGTSDACRQAVRYIFDENHDAVQHRLMYMYDTKTLFSDFHETQNFILSYQKIRFFDRW